MRPKTLKTLNIVSADLVNLINTNENLYSNTSYNILHETLTKAKDNCLSTKRNKFKVLVG